MDSKHLATITEKAGDLKNTSNQNSVGPASSTYFNSVIRSPEDKNNADIDKILSTKYKQVDFMKKKSIQL